MKHILEFIEKHKAFIKKVIILTIFVVINCLLNNPAVNEFFNTLFASEMAGTILTASASGLVFGALD